MKRGRRFVLLVLALAMILALAACGGNDKKSSSNNSNSTPAPTTQPEQTAPANPPASEPAPEPDQEPAASPEPAPVSGNLPDGAYYLYDGEHYLTANNFDYSNPSYTAISGTKGSRDTISITAEKADGTGNVVNVTLVKGGIVREQTNALDENPMDNNTAEPGSLAVISPIWVYNPTDTEITCGDAQLAYFGSRNCKDVTIDGKLIDTVDALIDALGTPTAAYGSAFLEAGYGEATICYIWLYDDFLIVAETGSGFDEAKAMPFMPADFLHCCMISDGILQEIESSTDMTIKNETAIHGSINILKALGLL